MLLSGIFPPITTPFYPTIRSITRNSKPMWSDSRTPVAGIVVLGSTGEAILLSGEEQREVLKTARESAANHKVLIAGTRDRVGGGDFAAHGVCGQSRL